MAFFGKSNIAHVFGDKNYTNQQGAGAINQQGESQEMHVTQNSPILSSANEIDALKELSSLVRLIESNLGSEHLPKIKRAIQDAEEEVERGDPDRDEIGSALERALKWSSKAAGFATTVEQLRPHVQKLAAWLGSNWHKLLDYVK